MSVEGIAVCGSVRGYLAHQYRGTVPCGWCTSAWHLFSSTTPAGGYHQRHIGVPDTPAIQTCAGCLRDLPCDDYPVRQWQAPGGVCTSCAYQARVARAARARDAKRAKAAVAA